MSRALRSRPPVLALVLVLVGSLLVPARGGADPGAPLSGGPGGPVGPPAREEAPTFEDVPDTHPFAVGIGWAAGEGVAAGHPDGTFRPAAVVSRQALAAFLHRLAHPPHQPPAPCTEAPFADVPADHPFCGAIAWLADQGLAAGYPDGTFRPAGVVSRQAVAAVLHRLVTGGAPAPCTEAPFADVPAGHPFCGAIAWLAGAGVAGGYPGGSFGPAAPVSRQVAVALLHRLVDGGLVAAPSPDWFTGSVDEFYVVPDPLPRGVPGQLIRLQHKSTTATTTTLRIMYHSRDAAGRDRAVTGTLSYPTAAAPEGGWPVVSVANGTVGLAPHCALSRGGGGVYGFGVAGVAVATDYIGLGPVGELHPYLSRRSEGHSVIDAVRAARRLPDAAAGDRWLTIGGSQGGHGALSAHELAAGYAPELTLLGTVAMAPGSVFDRSYGPIDELVVKTISVMMLFGAATEHPGIDPADYLHPDVLAAAAPAVAGGCSEDIQAAVIPLAISLGEGFFLADPIQTEPARSLALGNDVGRVAADAPVLLVSGTADIIVVIDRVRELFDRLCDAGQVTQYQELPGVDHGGVYSGWASQIDAWLADRLAGEPPVDSCA